jgi:hypothetical protein
VGKKTGFLSENVHLCEKRIPLEQQFALWKILQLRELQGYSAPGLTTFLKFQCDKEL